MFTVNLLVLLFDKNHVIVSVLWFEKIDLRKQVADINKPIKLLPNLTIFNLQKKITTPTLSYAHEQCYRPKKVYIRSILYRRRLYFANLSLLFSRWLNTMSWACISSFQMYSICRDSLLMWAKRRIYKQCWIR